MCINVDTKMFGFCLHMINVCRWPLSGLLDRFTRTYQRVSSACVIPLWIFSVAWPGVICAYDRVLVDGYVFALLNLGGFRGGVHGCTPYPGSPGLYAPLR